MKEQLAALYELQSLDVTIHRAEAALAELTGARALKQRLAAARKLADEAAAKLQQHETELIDSELKLKSIDEKRASVEKRLYGGSVSNSRELQALQKEVGILKDQQGKLDGGTLELYDLVETARSEARSAEGTVAQVESKITEALAQESSDRVRLEAELAEAKSRRDEAVAMVTDKSLLARYDAVCNKIGMTGIAKVVQGKCEGCNVAILAFTVRKLFEDKGFELCENCGRILMADTE